MSDKTNQSNINDLLNNSMNNLRTLVDVNTIVGDPIKVDGDTTIIPISKVTFGFGVGGADMPTEKTTAPFGGGSGAGVTIQPVGFITVCKGNVQLLQLSQGGGAAERLVNMVPGVMDKITGMVNDYKAGKNPTAETEDTGTV